MGCFFCSFCSHVLFLGSLSCLTPWNQSMMDELKWSISRGFSVKIWTVTSKFVLFSNKSQPRYIEICIPYFQFSATTRKVSTSIPCSSFCLFSTDKIVLNSLSDVVKKLRCGTVMDFPNKNVMETQTWAAAKPPPLFREMNV